MTLNYNLIMKQMMALVKTIYKVLKIDDQY